MLKKFSKKSFDENKITSDVQCYHKLSQTDNITTHVHAVKICSTKTIFC